MTWSTAFSQEGISFQTACKDSKEMPSIKVLQLIYTEFEEELNVSLILQIQNEGEVS